MCGIVGAIGKTIDNDFLYDVFKATETRGKEATGFWSPTTGIHKSPTPVSQFLVEKKTEYQKAVAENNIFIGHCRLATHGKPEFNYNNHPIESENWVLVHNGVVDLPDISDYPYKSDTDTENILAYIEKYGIKEGLSYVSRGAAIILTPKAEENTLYVWRTANSDMLLAYDQDLECIYICSGDKYLKAGLENISEYEKRLGGLFSKTARRIKLSEPYARDLWKISLVDGIINADRIAEKLTTKYISTSTKYTSYNYQWMWSVGLEYDWDNDLSAFEGYCTGEHRPAVQIGTEKSAKELRDEAYVKFLEYKARRKQWESTNTTTTSRPATGAASSLSTGARGTPSNPTVMKTTGGGNSTATTKSVVKNGAADKSKFTANDYVELKRDIQSTDAIYTTAGFLINNIGRGTMFQVNRVLLEGRYVCENYDGDIFTIPETLLKLAENPSCFGVGYDSNSVLCHRSCMFAIECQGLCEKHDDDELPECIGTFDDECETCTECWYLGKCLAVKNDIDTGTSINVVTGEVTSNGTAG